MNTDGSDVVTEIGSLNPKTTKRRRCTKAGARAMGSDTLGPRNLGAESIGPWAHRPLDERKLVSKVGAAFKLVA